MIEAREEAKGKTGMVADAKVVAEEANVAAVVAEAVVELVACFGLTQMATR